MAQTWFHIDMDAFFASVEQLDHPEYRGRPVVVGALPGHRGVVSTCSYEARAFGVHSAMPISEAYRRCPDGIYVVPRMERYHRLSQAVMAVFADYTPQLIQVSVDEAFLDLSGTRRLLGHPEDVARAIKERVRRELGLGLSIGVAGNKYVAKIASAFKKPDGLTIVPEGGEADFVAGLPLDRLWGLGKKTRELLERAGIRGTPELAARDLASLQAIVGQAGGSFLHRAARGVDPGIYAGEAASHSVSSETTFEADQCEREALERTLFDLSCHLMFRLREERLSSRVVSVKLRLADFSTFSARRTIGHAVASIEEAHAVALGLLDQRWDGRSPVRLIGMGFENADADPQAALFEDDQARRGKVERAVVDLRSRNPKNQIGKASRLGREGD